LVIAIIDELEALDENKDVKILNSCGKMCCRTNKMLDYIEKVRDTINIKNVEEAISLLDNTIYKNYSLVYKEEKILLDYGFIECIYPIVNEADITNAFMCNCTVGLSKAI